MSLPPLPSPKVSYSKCSWAYEKEQMQAYGQACRDAALEEAAKICDLRANGENDATWCAESIRSLKS